MRHFLPASFLFVSILISSCDETAIIYELRQPSRPGYYFENDTLSVSYSFANAIANFDVYNKLDIPLYIDWKNSTFIINTAKYPYYSDDEHIETKSVGGSVYYGSGYTGGRSRSKSIVTRQERSAFIPPHTKVSRTGPHIYFGMYYHPTNIKIPYGDKMIKAKQQLIDYESASQHFRNYLAVTTHEDLTGESFIDNEFYIYRVTSFNDKYLTDSFKILSLSYYDIVPYTK